MENDISWQEREIKALKAVQRNAATAISTKSTISVLSTTIMGYATTQRYIVFTPEKPCEYIQLSVSGFYDQAMTRPLETLSAGVSSLGYLLNSVSITAFQTEKSGNNFRLSVKFWKSRTGDIPAYLRVSAIGEQEGTFSVS